MIYTNQATNSPFTTTSSGTTIFDLWSFPKRIDVIEYPDKIEIIYKQVSHLTYTIHPSPPPQERVFKIIYSCKDGKWDRSEPIYGTIIPEQKETYSFE